MLCRAAIVLLLTSQLPGCAAAVVGAAAVAEGGRLTGMGEATFPAMMVV